MREVMDVRETIEEHGNMVQRICVLHLKNAYDTDDMFQNVFLKYALSDKEFDSNEHKKAWLARVCINECKDLLKSFYRRKVVSTEAVPILEEHCTDSKDNTVLEAVLALPDKYKNVIYFYYFEGYKGTELAEIMNRSEDTVYKWLSRGRKLLEERLGGDFLE